MPSSSIRAHGSACWTFLFPAHQVRARYLDTLLGKRLPTNLCKSDGACHKSAATGSQTNVTNSPRVCANAGSAPAPSMASAKRCNRGDWRARRVADWGYTFGHVDSPHAHSLQMRA